MTIETVKPKINSVTFTFGDDEIHKLYYFLAYLATPHEELDIWPEYMLSHRHNGTNAVYVFDITDKHRDILTDMLNKYVDTF